MSNEKPAGVGSVVLYEKRPDHVAVVTLNRPEARNAVNAEVCQALAYIVKATEADPEVRAVVLASSHDRVFCAGADLAEISRGNSALLSTEDGGFAGFAEAKRTKPWIAAVRGAALAGGCELSLACEMIVVSDDGRFGLPEVKRGLYAGAAGVYRLPRILPRNIALEVIATGDPIDAPRAFALGLANRMTAPEEVLPTAIALAGAIAVNAPLSVRESLKVARQAYDLEESALRVISEETKRFVFASDDAQEGPRAFLEKREPVWTGK